MPDDVWEPAVAQSLTRHRREVAARVVLGEAPRSRVVRGAPLEPRVDPEHRLEVHDVREIRGRAPWAEPTDSGAMDHTGKGPRGWPSDARIHEVVCLEMLHDPDLDASDLEVACDEGEVTLTGWVRSREEKRLAEWIADRVRGVRDVHNRLVVR